MRNAVSISLPTAIFRQLKSECRLEKANLSEVVRKALREYFFKSEFSRLRKRAMLEAAKRGISLSEEDIFKQIS